MLPSTAKSVFTPAGPETCGILSSFTPLLAIRPRIRRQRSPGCGGAQLRFLCRSYQIPSPRASGGHRRSRRERQGRRGAKDGVFTAALRPRHVYSIGTKHMRKQTVLNVLSGIPHTHIDFDPRRQELDGISGRIEVVRYVRLPMGNIGLICRNLKEDIAFRLSDAVKEARYFRVGFDRLLLLIEGISLKTQYRFRTCAALR